MMHHIDALFRAVVSCGIRQSWREISHVARLPVALVSTSCAMVVLPTVVTAAETVSTIGHSGTVSAFLWLVVILIVARFSGLIERLGQPSVLGELLAGVVLGNLILFGVGIFEPIKTNGVIAFLAELGVVILLFQVGLESNIGEMRRVGFRALLVALVGVVAPFLLGTYVIGPWLLPGMSVSAYLFLGAALTATSVGITARVFKDLGKLNTAESKLVLGAAVIDDVLGLMILAVISAIVTVGAVSLGVISAIIAKATLFLIGAIVLGQLAAPHLGRLFSKIHTGTGMKFTLALSFGLVFAFLADRIGLAPIVGAFAAGLVLDPVHFKFFREPEICEKVKDALSGADQHTRRRVLGSLTQHAHKHIEDLIEPVALFVVPVFFVTTGMHVRLETLFDTRILFIALGITVAAVLGKVVSGLAAGPVRKSIVGFGMVPRGEVGLIFATIGRSLGVVSDEVFSIIVIMVILTTLLTPPILAYLLKREKRPAHAPARVPALLD